MVLGPKLFQCLGPQGTSSSAVIDLRIHSLTYSPPLNFTPPLFTRSPLPRSTGFVPGYFNESLPKAVAATDGPRRLALLRLDADTYEGTLDILTNLYSLVSPRGFIIIDDFHLVGVRAAVRAFRKRVGATGAMLPIAEDYVNSCRQGGAAGGMGRVPFHTTPNKPPQGMYWRKQHA